MVSVDVKQHSGTWNSDTQELCESRGDRPGLPVPNNPYGLCGRKATFTSTWNSDTQELCESRGDRPEVTNIQLGTQILRSCVKVEVTVLGSPGWSLWT